MRTSLHRLIKAGLVAACGALSAPSLAQVVEPNGISVPGVSSNPDETSLQEFFDAEGEGINAVTEAAIDPSVFSPLCDFEAALVLRESQATAGIAWYNVPADPNQSPAEIFQIVEEGTPVGQVIDSAEIRTSPNYEGGLIGFALTRDGGQPVYYSEYQRNVLCTQCDMPDYWKMALSYQSVLLANTYYLGFEDWPGANDNSWQGNDGDMNDQVFRITGVSCPGGGDPCETGLQGVCEPGITECVFAGTLECKPLIEPTDEVCDALDNDCDGVVDNGDLCPPDEVCDKGRCVAACGDVLVTCAQDEVCNDAGFCVEAACADVECESGLLCVGGECQDPCDGVQCPEPLRCFSGRCLDPCDGVQCDPGRVCQDGVCVMTCDCQPCRAGYECKDQTQCVPEGCADQDCPAGTVCDAGECVDPCEAAVCPAGQICVMGVCAEQCADVDCATGEKCIDGACLDSCTDVTCSPGLKCVPGADNQGTCVDECAGVVCPDGQICTEGAVCVPGLTTPSGDGSTVQPTSDTGSDGQAGTVSTSQGGSAPATSAGQTGGTSSVGSGSIDSNSADSSTTDGVPNSPRDRDPDAKSGDPGCACRAAPGDRKPMAWVGLLLFGALVSLRRRATVRKNEP